MKIGFYPGSFNPWHRGHGDVLTKALKVFDHVIIGYGCNPEKACNQTQIDFNTTFKELETIYGNQRVSCKVYHCLTVDIIEELQGRIPQPIVAVIRGLRNGNDLQYEMNQQYWNEDLGLQIPIVYFITDRSLAHISSSAIRGVSEFRCSKSSSFPKLSI